MIFIPYISEWDIEGRKADKKFECDLCKGMICNGDWYIRINEVSQGDIVSFTCECMDCQKILEEYVSYNADGFYNADLVRQWWCETKCPACRYKCELFNQKYCVLNECDNMTHYCRCEKYEKDTEKNDKDERNI